MDYLRSCYRSSMRPFRDAPEVEIEGRWFWCGENAKALPIPHLYGASVWDDEFWDSEVMTLGEVAKGPWYSGESDLRLTGQRYCGPDDWWLNGSPLSAQGEPLPDEQGIPPCCRGPENAEEDGMRMRELDNSPDIPFVAELRVDQDAGLVLTHPGPNVAQLSLSIPLSAMGTVTSVGLSVPAYMGVSGSPITLAGTMVLGFNDQDANKFFAAPHNVAGQPLFRKIVNADLDADMIGVDKLVDVTPPLAAALCSGFVGGGTPTTWLTTPTPGKVLVSVAETGGAKAAWDDVPAGSISGFDERLDDRVSSLLVAGTNVTLTYNDGSNTLTIDAAGGSTSPAGSDKEVQFNDGGSFGSEAAFTYDKSNNRLTVSDATRTAVLNHSTLGYAGRFTAGSCFASITSTTIAGLFSDGTYTTFVGSSSGCVLATDGSMTTKLVDGTYGLDVTHNARLSGELHIANFAAATTPGAVVASMPIYDGSGSLIGYVPIYDAIT